jgi:hypothetical protein
VIETCAFNGNADRNISAAKLHEGWIFINVALPPYPFINYKFVSVAVKEELDAPTF